LRIPETTQERVREAAYQIGYYPNKLIRAVQSGKTGVLGIYLRWEQWSRPYGYFTTLLWAIQTAVAATEYQLLVHNARRGMSTEDAFARQAGGLVDGVLILNSARDEIVPRLLDAKLPAVEVGDSFSSLPFVGVDGVEGINLSMSHLSERGYRHPAYAGYPSSFEQDQAARSAAFQSQRSLLFQPTRGKRVVLGIDGVDVLAPLLAMNPRPDCVLCASDEMAYELLGECRRRGIRVPEELAVVGYDALRGLSPYPVTTSVHTPLLEMARLAVDKLIAIIDGEPYEHGTILRPTLRIGETT
jgi:LacI family transcriptional regulator